MYKLDPRNCAKTVWMMSNLGYVRDEIYRETGIDKDVIERYIEEFEKDTE